MSLITLKREIDIPTLVKWTLGVGGALVWLTLQYADKEAYQKTTDARLERLEGGMDVQNGYMILGKSKEYTKGAIEAMEAKQKVVP